MGFMQYVRTLVIQQDFYYEISAIKVDCIFLLFCFTLQPFKFVNVEFKSQINRKYRGHDCVLDGSYGPDLYITYNSHLNP